MILIHLQNVVQGKAPKPPPPSFCFILLLSTYRYCDKRAILRFKLCFLATQRCFEASVILEKIVVVGLVLTDITIPDVHVIAL